MEVSYLGWPCGVIKHDCESIESVYKRCGMTDHTSDVSNRVVEGIERNTLKWYHCIGRMERERSVCEVCVSQAGANRRERQFLKWRNRLK